MSTIITCPVPILGFCASSSGAGKTTLLVNLIPLLIQYQLRISVIKHAHHNFDIDHPGKDSYRLRESGAVQTLVGSNRRWALMTELPHLADNAKEPDLAELITHLDTTLVNLIIVEGFKQTAIPKIEVYRPTLNQPLLADQDSNIIAVASDGNVTTNLPVLNLNDSVEVAAFIFKWLETQSSAVKSHSSL
jgi:molybdopterin-guanine dinucleotide biosynthesis protein B